MPQYRRFSALLADLKEIIETAKEESGLEEFVEANEGYHKSLSKAIGDLEIAIHDAIDAKDDEPDEDDEEESDDDED